MKNNKFFELPLHIYPMGIFVSINQSKKQFKKSISPKLKDFPKTLENLIVEFENCDLGRCVANGNIIVIMIKDKQLKPDVIAHEIFHCCEFTMAHIGMPHGEDSSEAFAYLIGYLTKIVYENIQK